jgi:hypothetical protein
MQENWQDSIYDEGLALKQLILAGRESAKVTNIKKKDTYDLVKAHDAAESAILKVSEIARSAREQMTEYKSFSDAITTFETPLPKMSMSGRGLRRVKSPEDNSDETYDAAYQSKDQTENNFISRLFEDAGKGFSSIVVRS